MVNIRAIRNKINIIHNIKKITKTMELISASKMRKSQERIINNHPYITAYHQVINNVILKNLKYKHPYLNLCKIKRVMYVIISTDRGLCGSLNNNLFLKLLIDIKHLSQKGIEINLILIGIKAISFFSSLNYKILTKITNFSRQSSLLDLMKLVKIILKYYNVGNFNKLYIVSNKFVNTMIQKPKIIQLLPLLPINNIKIKKKYWDYLYESDFKTLFNILLYSYIESQIYQCFIENLASENASRMIAMKSATDNGNSLIKKFQLIHNKARQATITQELTEITSGASII